MAILKQHRNDVVSIGKGIGFNNDFFANRSFNGESSSINFWADSLYGDSLPSKLIFHVVSTFDVDSKCV